MSRCIVLSRAFVLGGCGSPAPRSSVCASRLPTAWRCLRTQGASSTHATFPGRLARRPDGGGARLVAAREPRPLSMASQPALAVPPTGHGRFRGRKWTPDWTRDRCDRRAPQGRHGDSWPQRPGAHGAQACDAAGSEGGELGGWRAPRPRRRRRAEWGSPPQPAALRHVSRQNSLSF